MPASESAPSNIPKFHKSVSNNGPNTQINNAQTMTKEVPIAMMEIIMLAWVMG